MAMSSETYESSKTSDIKGWERARSKRENVVGCYLVALHFVACDPFPSTPRTPFYSAQCVCHSCVIRRIVLEKPRRNGRRKLLVMINFFGGAGLVRGAGGLVRKTATATATFFSRPKNIGLFTGSEGPNVP